MSKIKNTSLSAHSYHACGHGFAPKPNQDTIPRSGRLLRTVSLSMVLSLGVVTGCQPNKAPTETDSQAQTSASQEAKDNQPDLRHAPSAEVMAQINTYEPLFVEQMLSLQQRLQAEYESLQSADETNNDDLTSDDTIESSSTTDVSDQDQRQLNTAAQSTNQDKNKDKVISDTPTITTADEVNQANSTTSRKNMSTEVGERDLTVLKKVSLEPYPPEMLDESQIQQRYRQALQALYSDQPLSSQDVNTLINITTLLPNMFEEPELASQLSGKSPALARLIVQHQVWRQIEAQQVKDMQQMKLEQQAEFESLMNKFNETIQEYDEQIAKYEEMLKEFERK